MNKKQYLQRKNQQNVIALAQTHDSHAVSSWFVALAIYFAGIFYFYGYWSILWWHVLTGS